MRHFIERHARRVTTAGWVWGGATAFSLAGTGCAGGGLPTDPIRSDPSTLLAAVEVNYKAIVLSVQAPYDTVRLNAVARNLNGEVLAHAGKLRFRMANVLDQSVSVDSNGLVRARSAVTSSKIEVSLELDGVRRVDTATVMVRSEPLSTVKIARLEFSPPPNDSAWRWAGNNAPLAATQLNTWVRLYNAQNQPIAVNRATLAYSSSNSDVHRIGSTPLYPSRASIRAVGETWLRVQVYAYDTAFVDSVLFRRIEPPIKFVVIDRFVPVGGQPTIIFYPARLEIKPGMTVVFLNRWGTGSEPELPGQDFWGTRILRRTNYADHYRQWVDSTGITFEAPPGPVLAGNTYLNVGLHDFTSTNSNFPSDGGTGDIPSFSWVQCLQVPTASITTCGGNSTQLIDPGYRSRRFTTPGTYRYSSTAFPDASGTIIVTEAP